jgi:alpha-beta hydrolase superfamily lysophospholipase
MIPRRGVLSTTRLFALAALGLAGCMAVPRLDPLPLPRQTETPLPPDMSFTMDDGMVLPARAWLPPAGTPWRGVILALHGYTDSRDGWEMPAPGFAAAGYAVFAPDQRGFGASPDRGAWAGTDRMVADAADIATQLRARHPGQRLIVMGESMGGAVALVLNATHPGLADATVLLAPAVWGWGQIDPKLGVALLAADSVAPGWKPNPGSVDINIAASDNRDALIRMGRDKLTLLRPTVDSMRGVVDLMTAAQRDAPKLTGPVLILDGRRDQVVPPPATARVWAHLPAAVRRAFYPNGYHLLLRDKDRALVAADILSWLENPDAWLPSGADVAAGAWQADQAWVGGSTGALPAGRLDGLGLPKVWPY